MPLFDFKCPNCGLIKEVLVRKPTDVILCEPCNRPNVRVCSLTTWNPVLMERQSAAPSFRVVGFNERTGYSSARTFKKDYGNGIKTEVTGHPEGFVDKVVP
jgi:hypothetical protein